MQAPGDDDSELEGCEAPPSPLEETAFENSVGYTKDQQERFVSIQNKALLRRVESEQGPFGINPPWKEKNHEGIGPAFDKIGRHKGIGRREKVREKLNSGDNAQESVRVRDLSPGGL